MVMLNKESITSPNSEGKQQCFLGSDLFCKYHFDPTFIYSINGWYSKCFTKDSTMKYGLYFEMMRYLFVIYPEIYDYYFNKMKRNLFNTLKMETWIDNFDQNANRILDVLNLVDTKENRDKLKFHFL